MPKTRSQIPQVALLTNLPIGEITRQCCFERESYLARLFKERFGCAMSSFRAASRNI